MSKAVKVSVIGAGSAQFSLGLVKDLCLTEGLAGSHVSFVDIDEERLDMIYKLATRYAQQLGSSLTFDKTADRRAALQGADFVVSTAYVLGHVVEADMRKLAGDKYGYYHAGGQFGAYHQLRLMLDVAQDIEKICPNAWLIQSGNPVFDGCTLMTRETGVKVCGLCHGHYHYREIAETIGIDSSRVTWQAPGFNHNIWLTHFIYEGKDAYPLIDEWIATKGEEYWRTHVAERTHDAQMSRGAVHQYHIFGLFPIGDTVRHRQWWWYHTDIATKKRWFGEPWGGPDTHLARPFFVSQLEERIKEYHRWAEDPKADLTQLVGTEKTHEQQVPIMDGLTNNTEGCFQVNVPNEGALSGIPDDVVVEVPAIVNQKGIQPLRVGSLPPKIMLECILPDWLDMERELLAFRTGDRSMQLFETLGNHQTRNYDAAVALLDELIHMPEVQEVEDWEQMARIQDTYRYPAAL
jgi:alpha-galactosidase/6-phospho-beta-glucosidase family protein